MKRLKRLVGSMMAFNPKGADQYAKIFGSLAHKLRVFFSTSYGGVASMAFDLAFPHPFTVSRKDGDVYLITNADENEEALREFKSRVTADLRELLHVLSGVRLDSGRHAMSDKVIRQLRRMVEDFMAQIVKVKGRPEEKE